MRVTGTHEFKESKKEKISSILDDYCVGTEKNKRVSVLITQDKNMIGLIRNVNRKSVSLAAIHAIKGRGFECKVDSNNSMDSVEITSVDYEGSTDNESCMEDSESLSNMDRENVLITKTNIHVNNKIEYISEESEDDCVDISTGLSSDDKILFLYPFPSPSERIENTAKGLRESCGLTCEHNVDNKVVIWNNPQDCKIFKEKERNQTEKVIHPK